MKYKKAYYELNYRFKPNERQTITLIDRFLIKNKNLVGIWENLISLLFTVIAIKYGNNWQPLLLVPLWFMVWLFLGLYTNIAIAKIKYNKILDVLNR